MSTLFGPILAAALISQFQGRTFEGTVVDDHGKPVAGAQVVFHAPAPWGTKMEPVEVRATTDAAGRFRLVIPSLRGCTFAVLEWAFHPGLAFAAEPGFRELPQALVLHKTMPRTVKIEGPDGRPVAQHTFRLVASRSRTDAIYPTYRPLWLSQGPSRPGPTAR